MYIVAIAWLYVVLMMSITERTAVAGVMTFLLYGVFPLSVVLYLIGTPQRKRNRQAALKLKAPNSLPQSENDAITAAAATYIEPNGSDPTLAAPQHFLQSNTVATDTAPQQSGTAQIELLPSPLSQVERLPSAKPDGSIL